jgi:uncharacterized protein (DUF433 family)
MFHDTSPMSRFTPLTDNFRRHAQAVPIGMHLRGSLWTISQRLATHAVTECLASAVTAAHQGVIIVEDEDVPSTRKGNMMRERIAVTPDVHFGKPCVAGTRIPVQSVLELVREGVTFGEITRDYYPDLSGDDIRACNQYAVDVAAVEEIQ